MEGQYPYFVDMVNEQNISLKNVWFINMDEYLTDDKEWIDKEDKLSFRGFMDRTVYTKIKPELVMPEELTIFLKRLPLLFLRGRTGFSCLLLT